MKLRIQGDSVRLRLTQSEVARFSATGYVADTAHFGPNRRLTYTLEIHGGDVLRADFEDAALTVFVPHAWAEEWAKSDRVGFEGEQAIDEGQTLRLLIEKDFECLHKRPDEEDAFPHPLAETPTPFDGE